MKLTAVELLERLAYRISMRLLSASFRLWLFATLWEWQLRLLTDYELELLNCQTCIDASYYYEWTHLDEAMVSS